MTSSHQPRKPTKMEARHDSSSFRGHAMWLDALLALPALAWQDDPEYVGWWFLKELHTNYTSCDSCTLLLALRISDINVDLWLLCCPHADVGGSKKRNEHTHTHRHTHTHTHSRRWSMARLQSIGRQRLKVQASCSPIAQIMK